MRISHSSSLFLATLAISSSSSTLAAPTEPGSLDTTGLPSSSSMRSLAMIGRGEGVSVNVAENSHGQMSTSLHMTRADRRDLLGLGALLDGLGGLPVVGPLLAPIIKALEPILGPLLGKGGAAVEEAASLTQDQVTQIAALFAHAANTLHGAAGTAVNGVVGDVSGAVSPAVRKRYMQASTGSSSASFMSSSFASPAPSTTESASSIEAMAFPTPPASLPIQPLPLVKNATLPITPPQVPVSAPKVPVGAPQLPVGAPQLPVVPPNSPALPVSNPAAPIARDAPPLFPAYKAADLSSSSSAYASPTSASFVTASGDSTGMPTMTASQSSASASSTSA
ncbi:hypothetical protein VTO73DRAFT_890 [Trametes versicolor]